MGLFSVNYNKPGPGVSKDAPPKKAFFRFWEIYFRKFFNLIKVNMLFAIPVAVAFFLMIVVTQFIVSINPTLSFLGMLPLVLIFPFVGGLTFVCRNYAREEHAFILSDFLEATKKNWKQFLLNGIICYVFYILMSVAVNFYSQQMGSNQILYIPFVVCCLVALLFVFAQFYIPVMIITFDLSLRQIYKNAFIFAILGLWRNLLLLVIIAVLLLASFIFLLWIPPLAFLVLLVLAVFWFFSFIGFLVNFAVYPLLVKYIINPYNREQEEKKKAEKKAAGEEEEEEEEDLPDFQDSLY